MNKIKIVFMGTPSIAVPILKTIYNSPNFEVVLVVTEPDKPAGRTQKPLPSAAKQFALEKKLKIAQPSKIIQIKDQLRKSRAVVALVTAYGQLIPEEILKVFKYGILNVHFSLLPRWRGASPIQYALMNGDKITGTTLMKMDKNLDTGPILAQKKIKIEPDDDFSTLSQKLTKLSIQFLEKSIINYLYGKLKPVPQDNSKATYTKLLKKEDGLIDWKKPAIEIANQIRAFSVWPKSYTFWLANRNLIQSQKSKRIIIKKATALPITPEPPAVCGTVFKEKETGQLAVLTGKGSLIIEKLQLEGKKEMKSSDFLNGYPQIIGETLKSKN